MASNKSHFQGFDKEYYIKVLEEIRRELIISKSDLVKRIGLAYATYTRLTDRKCDVPLNYVNTRKVRDFIAQYRVLKPLIIEEQ